MSIEKRAEKLNKILFDFFKEQWNQRHTISEMSNMNIKELFIIQTLGMKNDSATMSELASIFSIPATTMTSMIDRLVEKKYLKRFRSKEDRRLVKVSLSKKGQEFYVKQYNISLNSKISLLGKLSENEQEEFISLMIKLFSK